MKTKDVVMGLLVLILLITTIIFSVRSSTTATELEKAAEMSSSLNDLLRTQEYTKIYRDECKRIGKGKYTELQTCINAVQSATSLTNFFDEDTFKNYDTRHNESGYLVIKNEKGGKTFESKQFSIMFNNELLTKGCLTPGEIAPGFTCRFDLPKTCQPGDNLEILYGEQRAFLKTC